MQKFDFTLDGLIELLNTDGINSKGILKQSFKHARIVDLQKFKESIQKEIDKKVRSIVGKSIDKIYFDEAIMTKE